MHKKMLNERFGHQTFRPGQEETILSVLESKNTLAILPTASGKSLTYQLPSYLFSGLTLIVSPLISLMEDQVMQLRQQGEKRVVAYNSQLSIVEKKWVLNNLASYKFIFISPEALNKDDVIKKLQAINLSLLVVDEAHCISQWGIDFRPEYEQLNVAVRKIKPVKILALTATANDEITKDIENKLFDNGEIAIIRESVNRKNIAYLVEEPVNKINYLVELIDYHIGPGIIYFSSKKEAERVAQELSEKTGMRVSYYHGGQTAQERSLIQQQFLKDELDVLCATSAFGMGVNKKNIRYVVHYHLPSSLEAYAQESGRAGRDGKQSFSVILYQPGDERLYAFQTQELSEAIEHLKIYPDITKLSYDEELELYLKWQESIVAKLFSQAELTSQLERKLEEKKLALMNILTYLHTKECRRSFLLRHFQEKKQLKQENCCDNCGFCDKMLDKSSDKNFDEDDQSLQWEQKLKNLFNIK
ncbi:ATP-dependent DNA helicase RecQ [Vagococcus coleopterorum]|uniref:ATP-dependent DNA helicase RecQ n=1 Tax=Vagococcus coleopterorum TaxID=2714946 RepID=A0A6G8ANT3_9ENTE|nr:RecQ family ATP-dependent DNA helicase [Vagococcus coleopterorum]QIL46602.1 ATP-dependent DNA helicase RecQ [Vagococcus coleopterorum]